MIETQRLIPGAELKPGLVTIGIRLLDPDDEDRPRFAVLAIDPGAEYIVWTVNGGNTVNGTYVRLDPRRLFAVDAERAFLRALGDWLARI